MGYIVHFIKGPQIVGFEPDTNYETLNKPMKQQLQLK